MTNEFDFLLLLDFILARAILSQKVESVYS